MKKTLLLGTILSLCLLLSLPGDTSGQPFGGYGVVGPPGGTAIGLVDGGLHFHGNPADDHPMFESLERDTYQYEALHGYEHTRSEKLQQVDRFKDIRNSTDRRDSRSSRESFFGVDSSNPLKW